MSTTTLLDRAAAIPVTARAQIDRLALGLKNDLIAQAREQHAEEIAALRAEIASLKMAVAA